MFKQSNWILYIYAASCISTILHQFSSGQFSRSVVSDSLHPHELQHARPPCPSPTPRVYPNSCPLSQSVMPSSHLILCRPLLLLPPIPPSIRGFSNESTLRMRWPKYWSFSFSIIPSKEIPGLISLLSRLVITFLPRSKCLLISWLQSPSAVILDV